jgi:3-dehydroquinate synthase
MKLTVPINLPHAPYDVQIGAGVLGCLADLLETMRASSVVVIADERVDALHGGALRDVLSRTKLASAVLTFPAGEASKNLATYGRLLDGLFDVRPAVDRRTVIVTFGGGVAGDMGGFVAASALRGLRFIQCPTTLLADVDASVGGKTGLDHKAGKNLIGAFHQPGGVLIDTAMLKTLDDRQLSNGLAECVKHGVIRDESLLTHLESARDAIFARDEATLGDLVARNVRIKARVVLADEREANIREILNFGHTVGHAVEVMGGYDKLLHGEAVAIGMVMALRLARRRGLIDDASRTRVEDLLARLNLPTRCDNIDADRLWEIMLHDKKARGGKVRMILPLRLGEVAVFDDVTSAEIAETII